MKTTRKTINILDIPIDYITIEQALAILSGWLEDNNYCSVYTPNAEFMMEAWRNADFKEILSKADMCIADGAGIVLASKILKTPLPAKVPGIDLSEALMNMNHGRKLKVFLLGSKPGVADEAAIALSSKYEGVEIVGTHDGYFKPEEEAGIVNEIAAKSPDLLLVALGRMKQESFIDRNINKLNTHICMGVGGSLDVFAGRVRLAPPFFRKNGLEWMYRLFMEPRRFIRMLDLPRFVILIVGVRLGLVNKKLK